VGVIGDAILASDVNPDEADPLELQQVVDLVLGDPRLGVAGHVTVRRSQAERDILLGGHPVDDVDALLAGHVEVVAGVLQSVAGVSNTAVAFQPDALAGRGEVVGFDEHAVAGRDLSRAAVVVVGVDRDPRRRRPAGEGLFNRAAALGADENARTVASSVNSRVFA
jgi:hypothetical protein